MVGAKKDTTCKDCVPLYEDSFYYFIACCTATATATVAPTNSEQSDKAALFQREVWRDCKYMLCNNPNGRCKKRTQPVKIVSRYMKIVSTTSSPAEQQLQQLQ